MYMPISCSGRLQFERYCNPRKNLVFERHQFWQISQKDSETADQFVTRLKSKVKSCEYSAVDDMVRDKFVFSIRDLTVKELLLREDERTLEKVISMARASEASKEQIKMMGTKEQNSENPSVNEIRSGDKQSKVLRVGRDQVRDRKRRNVNFVVLLTRGDLVLPLAKHAATAIRKTISRMSAEKECEILGGKLYMPW